MREADTPAEIIDATRAAAGLGRLQHIDLQRAFRGGYVTAITRDHTPVLVIVDPAHPLQAALTDLGGAVLKILEARTR